MNNDNKTFWFENLKPTCCNVLTSNYLWLTWICHVALH